MKSNLKSMFLTGCAWLMAVTAAAALRCCLFAPEQMGQFTKIFG